MGFGHLERFLFALAHRSRSITLFDRVIHRSGDSTCADHALGAARGAREAGNRGQLRRHVTTAAFALIGLAAAGQAEATPFTYSGSIATYTVASSGIYQITAYGAQGGDHTEDASVPGLGAEVSGDVYLTSGTVLSIVVGGQGNADQSVHTGGGGGGGSFVYITPSSLLAAAGGGGGASSEESDPFDAGQSGTAGATPTPSLESGAGGTDGSGGAGASGTSDGGGGGGAGWLSNGGDPAGAEANVGGSGGSGPPSFAGGLGYDGTNGGFGGGGGGGYASGGGGGGYSGGGGGGGEADSGGGGGSYLAAQFFDPTLVSGVQSGDGFVSIDPVNAPEPASLGLMATALAFLSVMRRRALARRPPAPSWSFWMPSWSFWILGIRAFRGGLPRFLREDAAGNIAPRMSRCSSPVA